jgi:poly [ADP-ribose] polymerase 2/3/4
MRVPPMIKTLEELRKEICLLEVLSEIEVAVSSMDQTAKTDKNVHPLDKIYEKLNCNVKPLPNDDPMYEVKMIILFFKHYSF